MTGDGTSSGTTAAGVRGPSSSSESIRAANWRGSIPIVVSLARTSLSSPSVPPDLHRLVSRQTYLHVGLADCVRRMARFAVATPPYFGGGGCDDGDGDDDGGGMGGAAETWFEDAETNMPLRWHLFVGVLYDLRRRGAAAGAGAAVADGGDGVLPWRIRLHFTSYPSNQILRLGCGIGATNEDEDGTNRGDDGSVDAAVRHYHFNSLKQALFLQHGTSRVSTTALTRRAHAQLWDAVVGSNHDLYREVNRDLQASSAAIDEGDARSSSAEGGAGTASAGRGDADGRATGPSGGDGEEGKANSGGASPGGNGGLQYVPVRLMVDGKPPIQRPCSEFRVPTEGDEGPVTPTTLGCLLAEWLPSHFLRPPGGPVAAARCRWAVQGIVPPLSCPVVDLWRALCHPDHFLYVTVVTQSS